MKTNTQTVWTAYVRSDVYAGKVDEDGETPDQLSFYVICENERGDRYASAMFFTTEDYRGCYYNHNPQGVLAARLDRFLASVTAALAKGADPTKSPKWGRTYPMYGSEAYAQYGAMVEIEEERMVG